MATGPTTQTDAVDRQIASRTSGLYTRDAGQGPAVLLLHAIPFNSRMWEPQMVALRARARIIAPDLPGFGLSPMAAHVNSLSDYAREVMNVLDSLGIEELIAGGISSGTAIAAEMAAPLETRLKGLFLAGITATPDTGRTSIDYHRLAAEVESGGSEIAAAEYLPKLLGWTTQRTRPELLSWLQAIVRENSPAGIAAALRAVAGAPRFLPALPQMHCPVLCVAGQEDPLTPADAAKAMVDRIPGARVSIVRQAGHLVNLEAPQAFNETLAAFVLECDGRESR